MTRRDISLALIDCRERRAEKFWAIANELYDILSRYAQENGVSMDGVPNAHITPISFMEWWDKKRR